jgi:hypothetical protein
MFPAQTFEKQLDFHSSGILGFTNTRRVCLPCFIETMKW